MFWFTDADFHYPTNESPWSILRLITYLNPLKWGKKVHYSGDIPAPVLELESLMFQ